MKKLFRIIGFTSVILLFLMAILLGMSQTAIFKEWLRQIAEQQAAEHLNGVVSVGRISGTFITGIKLHDVEWTYEGERSISVGSVSVTLNPIHLLHREINIQNIILMDPEVRLVKDDQGVLNLNRLVRKRESAALKDTVETEVSRRWVYRLDNLEILGGSFSYKNHSRRDAPPREYPVDFKKVDFTDMEISHLYLTMSAVSDGRSHSFDIRSMNFTLADPLFTVSHLSLQGVLSPERSQINRLRLMTDNSNINITGVMYDYNLLGGNEGPIEEKEMEVKLYADRIHADDMKMFIPALWFIEGSVEADITAFGSINSIYVEKIDLRLDETRMLLSGGVTDVRRGKDLIIDASIRESRVNPDEVRALLPYFNIPDYGHIGLMDMNAAYKGKPLDFNAKLELNTSAGDYSGDLSLDISGGSFIYDGYVSVTHGDIRMLLQNPYYPYELDGRVSLKGEGLGPEKLNAESRLDVRRMRVDRLTFNSVEADMFAMGHELRMIADGFLENSGFFIDAAASVDSIESAPFSLRLGFESLNLEDFLNDSSYASDLSFSLTASGKGLLPANMLGEISIELEPSRFRDYEFRGDPVYISLGETEEAFRELNIKSEIIDVYLAGEFDLPTIGGIASDHAKNLVAAVRDNVQSIVTGEITTAHDYYVPSDIHHTLDAVYDLDIKNINAVAVFLGHEAYNIEIRGKLYGYLRSADSMVHMGGDIELDHFMFLSEGEKILLDRITGWYNIDNDYLAGGLSGIYSVFDISAGGVYSQASAFNNVRLKGDLRGPEWNIYSRADIDTVLGYEMNAVVVFDTTSIKTGIDDLKIRYNNLYFSNRDTVLMRYDRHGIWFDRFTLFHNEQSSAEIGGLYAFGNEHDILFNLTKIDIEELHRIASPEAVVRRQPLFNGYMDVSGNIGGTTRDMTGTMTMNVSALEYGNLKFGDVDGLIVYNENYIQFKVDIAKAEDQARTAFLLNGRMPFILLPDTGSRIPDGPIDVHIFSEGFDLSIIDPFLRDFRNFRGNMSSDVSITGTVENPVYDGSLEISDGYFTLAANDVSYHYNGKVEPRQNELMISRLMVENRRRDNPDGRMDFSGTIRTRGLAISSFDLRADGQLQVMRTGARRPGDIFFGDLTVATGSDGLRLWGGMEESMLEGTVLIRSASLTFPPVRASAYERTGSIVNYIVIEDEEEDIEGLTPMEIFFRDIARSQSEEKIGERSSGQFLDGLNYDFTIQTDGRVELTMIFNQATGEELTARLETTSLRLYRDEVTGTRLVGNVNVVEPSALSFYRRFDAKGTISFVGAPDNPEFDITAAYTGQRMSVQPASTDGEQTASVVPGSLEQVEVRLNITGDRYEPKLDINLLVNNVERSGDVETDAISFILTGRFQSELDAGDYRSISADFGRGIPATYMSGFATSLLSSLFSDFLRNEVRFIRTAEIVWYGGNVMDTAELRISGELRNFYWTIGGRVFNDIGNTNFSFQIPMGPVFNSERWTNLFLELERRSQSIQYMEEQRPVNAARLYYSISF